MKTKRRNDTTRKAREIYSRELGAKHLSTLAAQHDLALALLTAGQLKDAVAMYEETLKVSRGVLGPEHSVTLSTMKSLAMHIGKLADSTMHSRSWKVW